MNKNIVTIKYYEQQIRVELPANYTSFVKCLSTMLSIPKDCIDNFSIFYYDSPNYEKHNIKNSEAYDLFLNSVKEKKTDKINIELLNDNDNDNENNKNNIDKKKDEDDLFNNPYKESFYEDNKINEEEDMKQNSGNILNNIENENDYEAIEFSFLEEKKQSKDKNENQLNMNNNNNNINENNNKENIKINNPNINVNYNINSYYGQNKLVDNQIRGAPVSMNFNIKCNFCQKNQMVTVFYCKNCSIFFCTDCENKIGKNHHHCYYKIRNKEQFEEICKIHNNNNNKIKNVYGNYNNNNNINNNNSINSETIETKLNEFFSEGTKIIENTFNSVVKLFNTSNNQNNAQFINNNNINSRNNNIIMNNNNNNNLVNNRNDNNIKILVNKAKSQYNLGQIDDKEIEKALIVCKGNIDKAVALLLSNHNL